MGRKKNIVELTRCSSEEYLRQEKLPLRVLMDNVRSGLNVGAIFRTCDAFGVDEVLLAGITARPPHAEISKTALGAEESVRWRHVDDSVEEAGRLQREGWKIVVLEQVHGSIDLKDFRATSGGRYLLVAGNEVDGVDQRIVDMADIVVEIEQCGVKHSLNVASSTSIALWKMREEMIYG